MQSWSWRSPAFVPCDVMPVSDRGFRYGMSVFESLRVVNGRALFAAEHAVLLEHACADRGFPWDRASFDAAIETLQGNGTDGFARIYVTAGDGGVADPVLAPRIFLMLEQRNRPVLRSYHVALPDGSNQPVFGGLKTANYWGNVDALQRAFSHGMHEALLFNEFGELISACMGNVFIVSGGELLTPRSECGARKGVIREWVMRQRSVKETSIFVKDVRYADEIFITNSWIGVMPVASIDGQAVPSQSLGASLSATLEADISAQLSK